ncbi:putative pentatricopeptide repeat-containing protein At3g05240 [Typha angustifolia]|uniref:putative pentatricopeptide repeat-containing protein At3g05240 n=1 Tax=Typha angustifolia TaxID=59011 RepID=UPI003C2D420E
MGDFSYAQSILQHINFRTTYLYNSIIRGISLSDEPEAALTMYRDMQRLGLSPDNFTFPFVLKAIDKIRHPTFGCCVHARVAKTGYEADVYVCTTLIHMYISCGEIGSARTLFEHAVNRNVVTWTTMIAGYVEGGRGSEAINLFRDMEVAGMEPNEITVVHALVACGQCRDLETGIWIHDRLLQWDIDPIGSNVVLATALLNMYAQCGSLKTARVLFDRMPQKNEVSWNAMIGVYNQFGQFDEVLRLFENMRTLGFKPDNVTWLSVLGASANKGAMILGQGIHAYLEKTNGFRHITVSTSLMDMYSKTGDAQSALKIFHCMKGRDLLVWTSMIIGLAKHGHGREAVNLFKDMQHDGAAPDHITFIGVLTACSHAGMVEEGQEYFNSMRNIYGIKPTMKHYGCMVDLFSRAGQLAEAERLVKSMPIQPSVMIWGSILTGCEIHGKVDIAERIGRQIIELNHQCSGVFVLLSNIYAGAGRWQGVEQTRKLMWQKGLKKVHGSSSTECRIFHLHNFTAALT